MSRRPTWSPELIALLLRECDRYAGQRKNWKAICYQVGRSRTECQVALKRYKDPRPKDANRWTPEMEADLMLECAGSNDWEEIASLLGRSAASCRSKYYEVLNRRESFVRQAARTPDFSHQNLNIRD